MEFKYNYVGEETPVERLRNKLQPLFYLVELAGAGEDLKEFPDLIEAANDNLEDIRDHLSDIQPFYRLEAMNYVQTNTKD
jgi:hypothetical protein